MHSSIAITAAAAVTNEQINDERDKKQKKRLLLATFPYRLGPGHAHRASATCSGDIYIGGPRLYMTCMYVSQPLGVWTPWRKDQHLNYPPSRVLFPTMVTDRQPSGLPTEPRPMPGFSHQDELDPVEAQPADNADHAESRSSGRLQSAAQHIVRQRCRAPTSHEEEQESRLQQYWASGRASDLHSNASNRRHAVPDE